MLQLQITIDSRTFESIVGSEVGVNDFALLSQLLGLEVCGDKIYIKISEDLYHQQSKNFRTYLIGMLPLHKKGQLLWELTLSKASLF